MTDDPPTGDALLKTYLDATDGHLGTPRIIDDQTAPITDDDGMRHEFAPE